jgi:hypothetical protein
MLKDFVQSIDEDNNRRVFFHGLGDEQHDILELEVVTLANIHETVQ